MKFALQGRVERSWDASKLETGEGSSSERHKVPHFNFYDFNVYDL